MKRNIFNYRNIMVLLLLLCMHSALAQISEGGTPVSFQLSTGSNLKAAQAVDEVPLIIMPSFKEELEKVPSNKYKTKPIRFAKNFSISYSTSNSGLWKTLSDGSKLWRLRFKSPGAYSILISFTDFEIPRGSKLFIYNAEKSHIIGAFTSRNNSVSRLFATAPVRGDEVTVEYYEPKIVENSGSFIISKLSHDYLGILEGNTSLLKSSASCNIDINCPEGDKWQKEKRSVLRLIISDDSAAWGCTGALINNTAQDGRPMVLTANHCVCSEDQEVLAVFNFEKSTCGGTLGAYKTLSGASILANSASSSEFSLIEFNDLPPPDYMPYYSGWDISDNIPQGSVTGIHHPVGDVKKISFEDNVIEQLSVNAYNVIEGDKCDLDVEKPVWKIPHWEKGIVQPGSSGSPIFNSNHKIIGHLYAGSNGLTCENPGAAYYGRLGVSWFGEGDPNTRLLDWLDPLSSGVTTLIGYDPSCTKNMNITSGISGGSGDYLVNETIVANNIISGAAVVHYGAGISVKMTKGFKVNTSCHFLADLSGCDRSSAFKSATLDDFNLTDINVGEPIENKNFMIKLYPNPNNGIFTIENNNDETKHVTITDLKGTEVFNISFRSNIHTIDLSTLVKGLYILKVNSGKEVQYKKVILR